MRTRFNQRALWCAAAGASMLIAGAAQAALQDRDLDGDSVVDAFYDTDLNITWLRDANVNGLMEWYPAFVWADGYSFGGYSDWRLPSGGGCVGFDCTDSEMGHLWYIELGNPSRGPITNSGNFQNLQHYGYWSGTEGPRRNAAKFDMSIGYQSYAYQVGSWFYAMAVRPGDVPSVPEPESLALMLAGLTALTVAVRRRPR